MDSSPVISDPLVIFCFRFSLYQETAPSNIAQEFSAVGSRAPVTAAVRH